MNNNVSNKYLFPKQGPIGLDGNIESLVTTHAPTRIEVYMETQCKEEKGNNDGDKWVPQEVDEEVVMEADDNSTSSYASSYSLTAIVDPHHQQKFLQQPIKPQAVRSQHASTNQSQ